MGSLRSGPGPQHSSVKAADGTRKHLLERSSLTARGEGMSVPLLCGWSLQFTPVAIPQLCRQQKRLIGADSLPNQLRTPLSNPYRHRANKPQETARVGCQISLRRNLSPNFVNWS
jgi:hypothetical protein